MYCVTCGAPGYATGDTHLCVRHGGVPSAAAVAALVGGPEPAWPDEALDPPEPDGGEEPAEDRAPAGWQAFTWLFVIVSAVHAVLLGMHVWALRGEDAVLRRYLDEPRSIAGPDSRAVLDLVAWAADAVTVALWAYLLVLAVWFGVVGRVAARLGLDRGAVLRHWTYLLWRLMLIPLALYLLADAAQAMPGTEDRAAYVAAALAANHTAIVFDGLRIVMLGLLGAFVVVVWRRLSGLKPFTA
jgi:hypothetical protein